METTPFFKFTHLLDIQHIGPTLSCTWSWKYCIIFGGQPEGSNEAVDDLDFKPSDLQTKICTKNMFFEVLKKIPFLQKGSHFNRICFNKNLVIHLKKEKQLQISLVSIYPTKAFDIPATLSQERHEPNPFPGTSGWLVNKNDLWTPRSLTANASEKLPKPTRKGSPPNHHSSGSSC